MHYVKQFDINGVATKQAACIELHGAPTAATEGIVGVLGIDILSPAHEIYKCVAVNGSIYTWKLFGEIPPVKDGVDGASVLCALETRSGAAAPSFPFYQLSILDGYIVKEGDLIIDPETYLYQITSVESDACTAKYLGIRLATPPERGVDYWTEEDKREIISESSPVRGTDYWTPEDQENIVSEALDALPGANPELLQFVGKYFQTLGGTIIKQLQMAKGSYVGAGASYTDPSSTPNVLTFPFKPEIVLILRSRSGDAYDTAYNAAFAVLMPSFGFVWAQTHAAYTGEISSRACTLDSVSLVGDDATGYTMSWYDGESKYQMADKGNTYHYIAFGYGASDALEAWKGGSY